MSSNYDLVKQNGNQSLIEQTPPETADLLNQAASVDDKASSLDHEDDLYHEKEGTSPLGTATVKATKSTEDNSPIISKKVNLKKQSSLSSSTGSGQSSGKRRSSWRNLLNPSYKSRSDEFHKLFCDKIPKTERLIADYACALHREILIQGRVYISINYIAFYSNLFSWITKLVIRLRNIRDILKANTARIFPNAIQVILANGEKHIFASFVARDKSYLMLLRIWQNNLMNTRMTNEEMRSLVHLSYGKDLGMSDNEELNVNSPDPATPANIPASYDDTKEEAEDSFIESSITIGEDEEEHKRIHFDRNNNPPVSESGDTTSLPIQLEAAAPLVKDIEDSEQLLFNRRQPLALETPTTSVDSTSKVPSRPIRRKNASSNKQQHQLMIKQQEISNSPNVHEKDQTHSRYNSIDYGSKSSSKTRLEQDSVMDEVLCRLNDLQASSEVMSTGIDNNSCSSPSSLVIVDTPPVLRQDQQHRSRSKSSDNLVIQKDDEFDVSSVLLSQNNAPKSQDCHSLHLSEKRSVSSSSTITRLSREKATCSNLEQASSEEDDDDFNVEDELAAYCDCGDHEGQLIAEHKFDINVDTLFNLIFTNSKFIRANLIRRGILNATIGIWRSHSDLMSPGKDVDTTKEEEEEEEEKEIPGQVVCLNKRRRLKYTMSLNHMWAKEVQIEELQWIKQVKRGVYVVRSQTRNSGIPYGETFSVEMSYCLIIDGSINKSRMLVHASVQFDKEKLNWKLSMVKPMIERQSIQGVRESIRDLAVAISEYIGETLERARLQRLSCDSSRSSESGVAHSRLTNQAKQPMKKPDRGGAGGGGTSGRPYRSSASLVRAKSKLKERKLRNMYRYYVRNQRREPEINSETDAENEKVNEEERKYQDVDEFPQESSEEDAFDLELDDTDSMIMMMRNTESPLSLDLNGSFSEVSERSGYSLSSSSSSWTAAAERKDKEKSSLKNAAGADNNEGCMMEKSFSDVEENSRFVLRRTKKKKKTTIREKVKGAGRESALAGISIEKAPKSRRRRRRSALLAYVRRPALRGRDNPKGKRSLLSGSSRHWLRDLRERSVCELISAQKSGLVGASLLLLLLLLLLLITLLLFLLLISHVRLLRRLEQLAGPALEVSEFTSRADSFRPASQLLRSSSLKASQQ